MKDFSDLSEWGPKRLRTLRNNLNNRIESFKNNPNTPKSLQSSHMLYGMSEGECLELLKKVKELLSKLK